MYFFKIYIHIYHTTFFEENQVISAIFFLLFYTKMFSEFFILSYNNMWNPKKFIFIIPKSFR